jgi:ABC-type amino acid transport system permease subunit
MTGAPRAATVPAVRSVLCAAACLPAGFGVAVASGVRPLGGVVLVLLAWLAARHAPWRWRWWALVLALFVASHLLGRAIGAWPAVAVVTALAAAAFVAERRRAGYQDPALA